LAPLLVMAKAKLTLKGEINTFSLVESAAPMALNNLKAKALSVCAFCSSSGVNVSGLPILFLGETLFPFLQAAKHIHNAIKAKTVNLFIMAISYYGFNNRYGRLSCYATPI